MGLQAESPRCNFQVYLRAESDGPEPSEVCSCPAGLIHMHDCPVTLGLECVHFTRIEAEPEGIDAVAYSDCHERLMGDFLSRLYFHRIRSLAPKGDAWHERQAELAERYKGIEPEPDDAPDEISAEFEAERARLLAIRRKREEQRQEREEQERQEKQRRARERAERALKEAEARAAKRLRSAPVKKRRHPRKKTTGAPEDAAPNAETAATDKPRKKRRRRRRGRRGKGGGGGESAG